MIKCVYQQIKILSFVAIFLELNWFLLIRCCQICHQEVSLLLVIKKLVNVRVMTVN
ncbi:unknown [Prevotella sp. CAG:474]|nr:unknown [Prevotella sp. CAG:474]